jgi:DNA-binding MarR family transcriptional regulator
MTDGPYHASEISLESSLGYYLSKARNVLAERMDRAVKPLGLTAPQIGIVLLLSHKRATTPFELSRAMSYDSGSMTRMLDRLAKKGFIARTRSEVDRRVVKLELTSAGQDAAAQLPALCAAVLDEQLRGFSPDEVGTLVNLLSRFVANSSASGDSICVEHTTPAGKREKVQGSLEEGDK